MDLVICPFNDYKKGEQQGFRDREHHFIEALVKAPERFERVLIIDRPVSAIETLVKRNNWHVVSGKAVCGGFNWKVTAVRENVFVLDYLEPSILRPALLKRCWWNEVYRSPAFGAVVEKALDTLCIDDYVVLIAHPFAMGLVEHFRYRALFFDAIDNFEKIEHFSRLTATIHRHYAEVAARAKVIFTVSPEAKANLFAGCENVRIVSNGVDPDFFHPPYPSHNISRLKESKQIKLGYVGTLSHRLDLELLTAVTTFPDVEIFLIGPAVSKGYLADLRRRDNVFLHDSIHYTYLPSILQDFDVCILPHRLGKPENDGNAIKLYEYIAAKKPVIATCIKGTEPFADNISLVDGVDQFREALDLLIKNRFEVSYPEDLLDQFTWQLKADQLFSTIVEAAHEPDRHC
jgi:teichuronic acid biosynthesis glycosyltransferase TuaH